MVCKNGKYASLEAWEIDFEKASTTLKIKFGINWPYYYLPVQPQLRIRDGAGGQPTTASS